MAVNANIALQGRLPQIQNPLESYGQAMQIQNAQQQNKLAHLMYSEKEKEAQQNELLNAAYKSALGPDGKIDRNKLFTTLSESGLGSRLPSIQKGFLDTDKAEVDLQGSRLGNDRTRFDLDESRRKLGAQKNYALISSPDFSFEKFVQHVQEGVANGDTTPEQAQAFLSQVPRDPEQLRAVLTQRMFSTLSPKEQVELLSPKFTSVNDGQQTRFVQTNPHAPGGAETAPIQMQATPGQVLSAETTRTEGAANRGVQTRGQNLVNQRAAERNSIEQRLGGKAPTGYRFKEDGTLEPIPGGPASADREGDTRSEQIRFRTVQDRGRTVLRDIDRAYALSDKSGPISGTIASRRDGNNNQPLYATLSPAYELEQHLESIKSNISIDQLQLMREASPTGGALGQVPVRQQEYLMSVLGTLKSTLPPKILRENLAGVADIYANAMYGSDEERADAVRRGVITQEKAQEWGRLRTEAQRDFQGQMGDGKKPGAAPKPAGAPAVGTVQGGYRFKGGDPSNKSNWVKQ